ncbi:MAG: hypothetical protein F6K32_20680, partial [Desertifilum sp. SIO1I2]|nr:hypothetical protein [Desertifilum sp. SIO1I2]
MPSYIKLCQPARQTKSKNRALLQMGIAIALSTGFLFGVAYRYIIRSDR